jgi:hypothetical protein
LTRWGGQLRQQLGGADKLVPPQVTDGLDVERLVLLVIGAALALAGFAGREIGGRKHYY